MHLIVGLGNPGGRYRRTRHNLGFMVADVLAARAGIALAGRRHEAESGQGRVAGVPVLIAKPLTFMNESGTAVAKLRRAHHLDPSQVIALYDDLDLPLARVRIRGDGGAGGHNGVASLISVLGRDFARVRVGIGRPPEGVDAVEYVLQPFAEREWPRITEAIERAADAVESLLRDGLATAMNLFNRRVEDPG